ncbi:hypothetical protein ACROYT_G031963 [Oculina patagonica]
MCPRRHLSSVYFWIFFAFLLYKNRITCRSPQQTPRPSEQNAEVRSLEIKGEKGQSMLDQTKRDPRKAISCNCSDFCPDPNSSELQKLVWIENYPIFCKETGRLDIEKKPYLAACFFFCCRKCNGAYHKCVLTNPREYCLKAAYECAGTCLLESSLKIKIKGW